MLKFNKLLSLKISMLSETSRCHNSRTVEVCLVVKFHILFHVLFQSLSSLVNELEEKVCSLKEKPQMSSIKITSDWIETKCNYILAKLR